MMIFGGRLTARTFLSGPPANGGALHGAAEAARETASVTREAQWVSGVRLASYPPKPPPSLPQRIENRTPLAQTTDNQKTDNQTPAVWSGDFVTLPEEFWVDFDQIVALLNHSVERIVAVVEALGHSLRDLSDKEVGLRLGRIDPDLRPFIFAWRKQGGELMKGRPKEAVLRKIRPTANHLPGYTPSYALNRILDEAS
jgi:hypothetical protein